MSGETLTQIAEAFRKAGHEPERGLLRCRKCKTTLYEFWKKGKLPCLVDEDEGQLARS